MASAWGTSWGSAWGNSWGSIATDETQQPIVGGGFIKKKKRTKPIQETDEYQRRLRLIMLMDAHGL